MIARIWAGYLKREDFRKAAESKGISYRVLGSLENGDREPRRHEREALTALTNVPEQFFTDANYDPFGEQVSADDLAHRLDRIENKIDAITPQQEPAASEPDAHTAHDTPGSSGSSRRLRTSVRSELKERPPQADGGRQRNQG